MRFLANENSPGDAIAALLKLGHDVIWIRTEAPGISDAAAPELILTRPKSLLSEQLRVSLVANKDLRWFYNDIPTPPPLLSTGLSTIIEPLGDGDARWWPEDEVGRHMQMMKPVHREMVEKLAQGRQIAYRTFYRRRREDQQRAEFRDDDLSGCLRTAVGGSGKQFLIKAGQGRIRMRAMTPREYARLQGVPDDYPIAVNGVQALTGFGDVLSQGGEVTGARSGLGKILEKYGLPPNFLKEVTTRQGRQDGRRLFEGLEWGIQLTQLSESEREKLLLELIGELRNLADSWLNRQNLKPEIDRRQAPTTWIEVILENARGRSAGVVEQQLVGAKLTKRFKSFSIPNHPAHAGDKQTERDGDFAVARLIYHVTAAPSRDVLGKCARNIAAGLQPILLVPRTQMNKAQVLAQDKALTGAY